jgi:hypothetical protein
VIATVTQATHQARQAHGLTEQEGAHDAATAGSSVATMP